MKTPQRMFPAHGGTPLPWSPIVIPGFTGDIHKQALAYVHVLDQELATGQDGGALKWDAGQRRYLRGLRAKWIVRAEGKDAHYEKFGTFPRNPGAPPPTVFDLVQEQTRRRLKDKGDYVSSAQHRRNQGLTLSQHVHAITRRWKKQSGAKNPDEMEKPND